jgi:hypothetical protein
MRAPIPSVAFHGIPSFFRSLCRSVKRQLNTEHRHITGSYSHPAYELSRHLADRLQPGELDREHWETELAKLGALLRPADPAGPEAGPGRRTDAGIGDWFQEHYPRCMALIPRRRRHQFVAGVRSAFEDGILVLPEADEEGARHE